MSLSDRPAYRAWLLVVLLIALALTAIRPPQPTDFVLEHLLTVAAIGLLVFIERRRPLGNLSCTLIFAFLMLHVIGARTTYSMVPYDDWSEALVGRSISETFGWQRNHYDRLVHFAFGLLMVIPARELVERGFSITGWRSILVAIAFVAVASKLYELIEWLIAVTMSPEDAGRYNGEQGDVYDAQKDMGLAFAGSLVTGSAVLVHERATSRGAATRQDSPRRHDAG